MESKEDPIVLENTVVETYKADVKWVEPHNVEPINEFEKEMLKNTKTVEQLLEEERNEVPEELTEEEIIKRKRKEYITKVKVISLDKMGKHPLSNPSTFSKKEKDLTIKTMKDVMTEDNDVIDFLFNEICNDKLFNETADYSTYPVFKELV